MRRTPYRIEDGTRRRLFHKISAAVVIFSLTFGMLTQTAMAQNTYIITDGDQVTVHTTSSSDTSTVLDEAGLTLGDSDSVTTQTVDGVSEIVIKRAQIVTVNYKGSMLVIGSYGETVRSLLENAGITLSEDDQLSCDPQDQTYDGMSITITNTETKTETVETVIPYETTVYESSDLDVGAKKVVTKGVSGKSRCTYEVTYQDGKEVSRTLTGMVILQSPVNEVLIQNSGHSIESAAPLPQTTNTSVTNASKAVSSTKTVVADSVASSTDSAASAASSADSASVSEETESASDQESAAPASAGSIVTAASGDTISYSSVIHCEATAYTGGGTTASGTTARVGEIAVDPSVIPLGTQLYIISDDGMYIYGTCVAEDTGSAIQGNIVDLYFNSYDECMSFGRRNVTIYVLS